MKQRALLLVDLQNDFCAGGALAVAEGDSTVDVANALIAWCKARGEAVVASQDWHPADHGSFASQHNAEPFSQGELDGLAQTLWPDHCVQQTEGAQLHPLLNQHAIDAVFHKGENPLIDSYSAFFDNEHRQQTALDEWLRHHEVGELIVMGLATDYCVKYTVLDALKLGYRVNVITDGCRGVNLNAQDSALAFMEMSTAGATLYTLADWQETQA
ncbi:MULTISPECIES: bifunctional nicotinamidase/pyrazinamidase [Lelliottia]|jgi:nicotinamidase/pyrazinamidase|uniref:nicotinamidase n=1 Tax=Lelliottia amnigena TaxID=61646 RepID=A0ABU7UFK8_LELAM|nr:MULTISPECIES: bifunctional nicotinamidase/pyrazinamidase [Lelliottia]ATG00735.1 nicotinamidase/pyrazinamidase [Lelliottia amnigena]MBL5919880.1 bifunctional nicotinamidase/pyrazinamidase [Lelliottia amnigena]MBL5929094.1 bifunctional nicotinamidase/pyrazinamidase [Lelliottia amnigena]MBL5965097.1 bifunctional nicotinamidase/pyrazinamidase [Lelliottia amnigena]MBM7357073.1 nicotinamidase/pyrazinamidase [Lelliottia amnigena]